MNRTFIKGMLTGTVATVLYIALIAFLTLSCGPAYRDPVPAPAFSYVLIKNLTMPGSGYYRAGDTVACELVGIDTEIPLTTRAWFNDSAPINSSSPMIVTTAVPMGQMRCTMRVEAKAEGPAEKEYAGSSNSLLPMPDPIVVIVAPTPTCCHHWR